MCVDTVPISNLKILKFTSSSAQLRNSFIEENIKNIGEIMQYASGKDKIFTYFLSTNYADPRICMNYLIFIVLVLYRV